MPVPAIKDDGYARDLHPLGGEQELDRLAGLADLCKVFAVSGQATISAQGASLVPTVVVATSLPKGREGILVAFAHDNEAQDYPNTPWWVMTANRNQPADGAAVDAGVTRADILMGPFRTQVGAMATPFTLPFPVPLERDKQVAIFATNGTGAEVTVQGFLYGITWDYAQTRAVRRALWANAKKIALWDLGLFGGDK